MRIPKRRGEELRRIRQVSDDYLTEEKIEKLKRDLNRLIKIERPQAIFETQRLAEMGDFSENVGYQIAKANLRRINDRIILIEERLKRAIVIESGADSFGRVRIGSTVVIESDGVRLTYKILGSQETDPLHGRISHLSPIGSSLIGRSVGDDVAVRVGNNDRVFKILEVR
jgi:transcription elongation GreA/GreB family factor